MILLLTLALWGCTLQATEQSLESVGIDEMKIVILKIGKADSILLSIENKKVLFEIQ